MCIVYVILKAKTLSETYPLSETLFCWRLFFYLFIYFNVGVVTDIVYIRKKMMALLINVAEIKIL